MLRIGDADSSVHKSVEVSKKLSSNFPRQAFKVLVGLDPLNNRIVMIVGVRKWEIKNIRAKFCKG